MQAYLACPLYDIVVASHTRMYSVPTVCRDLYHPIIVYRCYHRDDVSLIHLLLAGNDPDYILRFDSTTEGTDLSFKSFCSRVIAAQADDHGLCTQLCDKHALTVLLVILYGVDADLGEMVAILADVCDTTTDAIAKDETF